MRDLTHKVFVLAFAASWVIAPAFPSIVCALTLPSESRSALVETPDCHQASDDAVTASDAARPRRACCEDAATSCCLRALDVDGAVNGVSGVDATPVAVISATTTAPAAPPTALPVFVSESRAHAPPGSHFRVLRL